MRGVRVKNSYEFGKMSVRELTINDNIVRYSHDYVVDTSKDTVGCERLWISYPHRRVRIRMVLGDL